MTGTPAAACGQVRITLVAATITGGAGAAAVRSFRQRTSLCGLVQRCALRGMM
ncbi:hypothetical protein ACFPM0_26540 [Pseudonocardia sulfidoxydans]|uniref:hypothetical protein n=1 Tax=Pseudonocardia sulfidoxydans TaxID=54011 RepID=UPI00360BB896